MGSPTLLQSFILAWLYHLGYTGCFISSEHYCRRLFPTYLWCKKFLSTWILFSVVMIMPWVFSYSHTALVWTARHTRNARYTQWDLEAVSLSHGRRRISYLFQTRSLQPNERDVRRLRVRYLKTFFNPLTSNDHYSGRTAPLTSKRCILYIYSTNIGTEYFKLGIYCPFFLFKMQFVS